MQALDDPVIQNGDAKTFGIGLCRGQDDQGCPKDSGLALPQRSMAAHNPSPRT